MENKSFDDIIKNKVDQFSSEIESNAWDLFQESQRDALFDDGISEKIGEYSISEIPNDFESIADKIPQGFDSLIGAKLAGLSMDATPDWDQFEKMLDGEGDDAFDEKVTEAVKGYTAPVSESQWPKLAEHLARVEKRRRRILITKFVEAAVFLLFILTIMQLYPIQNITKGSVFRTVGVTEALNSTSVAVVDEKNHELVNLEEGSSQVESVVEVSIENIDLKEIQPLFVKEKRNITYRSRIAQVSAPTMGVKEIAMGREGASIAYMKAKSRNFKEHLIGVESRAMNEDHMLAMLDIKDLSAEDRIFDYPVSDLTSQSKKKQYWFNIYGSPEMNLLHTPYDKSYSASRFIVNEDEAVPAYSHLSNGYSVGASISKETANMELEGGFEYTSLNYFPKQIEEVTGKATDGYTTTILKEIIFDIVEIPLNIKYNIFKKKGWKIYGNNGISAGVVAFATYDIDEEKSKPIASLEITGNRRVNEDSFVDRKEFNSGVVRTGNFRKNAFATVNAGFGVSKEISDKIAFYVQPTYYHNLSQGGLGPNNDVHHRLSVQIGTKVRI